MAYTSPPPTAEPLLKEKPFGGWFCPAIANRCAEFPHSAMSPWHADAVGAGLAKPDQGEKQETNGEKLAFLRAVQAFPCHGGRWAAGGQGHSQFNSIDFHVKPVLWYFLGSRKYRPSSSPSFSPPVPHTKQQPHASSLRHAAVFLQETLS